MLYSLAKEYSIYSKVISFNNSVVVGPVRQPALPKGKARLRNYALPLNQRAHFAVKRYFNDLYFHISGTLFVNLLGGALVGLIFAPFLRHKLFLSLTNTQKLSLAEDSFSLSPLPLSFFSSIYHSPISCSLALFFDLCISVLFSISVPSSLSSLCL